MLTDCRITVPPRLSATPTATTLTIHCVEPPSQAWTASDEIALVNDGIAGLLLLVTFASVWIASRAVRDQLRAPARQRRHVAYYALVANPAIDLIAAFGNDADELLRAGVRDIERAITASASDSDVRALARSVIRRYRERWRPLHHRLLRSVQAWGDADLVRRTSDALDELQDAVTKTLPQLVGGSGSLETTLSALRDTESVLLSVIVKYDFD